MGCNFFTRRTLEPSVICYHFITALLNLFIVYFKLIFFSDNTVGLKNSHIFGTNTEYLANLTNLLKPVVQSEQDWKLCWRASRDGWNSIQFHSLCDGKGPTITIIKVGKYIFGGFTSVSWCKYRHRSYLQGWSDGCADNPGNFDYLPCSVPGILTSTLTPTQRWGIWKSTILESLREPNT